MKQTRAQRGKLRYTQRKTRTHSETEYRAQIGRLGNIEADWGHTEAD